MIPGRPTFKAQSTETDLCKGGCGWSLSVLGPPMGTSTIPDLGGYCADCLPCTATGKAVSACNCDTCLPPFVVNCPNVGCDDVTCTGGCR